jgi:hypothetical protein
MGFSTLYWWEWVAYLFGFSSFITVGLWLLTTLKKRPLTTGYPLLKPTLPISSSEYIPEVQRQGKRTVWISTLCLLVGLAIGYMSRDHQLSSNKFTYTDVSVLKRISDREFVVWPDRMKQQHVQLCPESSVGWYEGETLDDWTFEQQRGCKRVVSYHEKQKGEINASVQIR